jgi:hypothetical protein
VSLLCRYGSWTVQTALAVVVLLIHFISLWNPMTVG